MKRTPGSQLVNVSSCASLYGAPKMSIYAATKFAVRGLSEALDIEFGRLGVGVKCIMPWFVETPILDAGAAGSNEKMSDALRQGVHAGSLQRGGKCSSGASGTRRIPKEPQAHRRRPRPPARSGYVARLFPGLVRRQLAAAER